MFLSMLAITASLQPALSEPLQPMAFLVGHCWQADFPTGERDTHCFEPVYGGRFIRDRHEVTGGRRTYAGETLYAYDAAAQTVGYTYWSNDGGISRGTMRARDGLLDFGDEVHRRPNGREIRISTNWRQVDATTYEVVTHTVGTAPAPRVMRYRRVDQTPVAIETSAGDGGTTNLSHEIIVPASPTQVYAALAGPDGWRRWAVPNAWASADDPDVMETSYSPDGSAGDPRNIRQRFLVRVPERLVAFRTIHAPPGFPHAEAFYRVTHLFELSPAGGGTRVRLTGIGYPAGEAGTAFISFFRDGNRTSLEALRQRFAAPPS